MSDRRTEDPSQSVGSTAAPMAEATPSTVDDSEIPLTEILVVALNAFRSAAIWGLSAGILALGLTYLVSPRFTATTRIMPPPSQSGAGAAALLQSLGSLGGLAAQGAGLKNPGDLYVSLLKTRSVQDALIAKFDLKARYEQKLDEPTRIALSARTSVSNGKNDGIITISVWDHDPKFAAELADAHVRQLQTVLSRLSVSQAQASRVFFEKQLQDARSSLAVSEAALKEGGGPSVDALKTNPTFAVNTTAQTKAQLTALELRIQSVRNYMSESSFEFRQMQHEAGVLRGQLARLERSADDSPSDAGKDYLEKVRRFKHDETLVELLTKQYEAARLEESREGGSMQLVDKAVVPEFKTYPKRGTTAVLVTLLVFGFYMVFKLATHFYAKSEAASASGRELREAFFAIFKFQRRQS